MLLDNLANGGYAGTESFSLEDGFIRQSRCRLLSRLSSLKSVIILSKASNTIIPGIQTSLKPLIKRDLQLKS